MIQPKIIPEYHNGLADFVADLRFAHFSSQSGISKLVGIDRSVISRYESGRVQPKTGYIAVLAQQFVERQQLESAPEELSQYQQKLLEQVNLTIHRAYESTSQFGSWERLVQTANEFIHRDLNTVEELEPEPLPIQPGAQGVQDLGRAPDVKAFYGRVDERHDITQSIVEEQCRLVCILGIGGVGKSMLASRVAHQIAPSFEYVIWRSIQNEQPLQDLLHDFISLLSGQTESTVQQPETAIYQLLELLRAKRALLIIDNVEVILQGQESAGSYRAGFEAYGDLFRIIGESDHQSSLLLTSREKPKEVAYQESSRGSVRIFSITGASVATVQDTLADKELTGNLEAWRALTDLYAGNLLALKMISETIHDIYLGDIAEFLEDKELTLVEDVSELISEQLERLSSVEESVTWSLAVEREETGIKRLSANFSHEILGGGVRDALQSLHRRSLLVRSPIGYTLHPMINDYVTEVIVEEVTQAIIDGNLGRFNSHPLLKADARDYIREHQTRLFIQPIVSRLTQRYGRPARINSHLMSLLDQLRLDDHMVQGYAAGNLFNILNYLGTDLSQADFSSLSVWQAYMIGTSLHQTNFAHADLSQSVFMEVFNHILSLCFDHTGKILAAGSASGQIHLWDFQKQQPILTLVGHTGWVSGLCFHPDGSQLYSVSTDDTIKVWDIRTGQCLRTLRGHEKRVVTVDVYIQRGTAPDGSDDRTILLTGGEDETIRMWDVDRGREIRILTGHDLWIWSVRFRPDGRRFLSASGDRTIRIWDTVLGDCLMVLEGHTSWVWSAEYSPDGKTIVSAGHDGTVRLWDAETGDCLHVLAGHNGWIRTVAFHPDGDWVASCSNDQTIRLWDVHTGQQVTQLRGHEDQIRTLAFHPDGKTLVTASEDRTIRLWDLREFQPIRTLYGYNGNIRAVAVVEERQLFASAGQDKLIHLWDLDHEQPIQTLTGHTSRITSLDFSPDGSHLISGSHDRTARLWDIKTGRAIRILHGHDLAVWGVTFSPDGKLIATSSYDTTVRIWDAVTGECYSIFKDVDRIAEIIDIAFSHDGTKIAIGCENTKAWIWDIASSTLYREFAGHKGSVYSVALSPDDQQLYSASLDGFVNIWDIERNECLAQLEHGGQISDMAVHETAQLLVTGGLDQKIRVWDLQTRQQIQLFQGHSGAVLSVAFIDENRVVSAGQDETIRVWAVDSGICVKILRVNRIYEGMDITGVTGISATQHESLLALGAIDESIR